MGDTSEVFLEVEEAIWRIKLIEGTRLADIYLYAYNLSIYLSV